MANNTLKKLINLFVRIFYISTKNNWDIFTFELNRKDAQEFIDYLKGVKNGKR